MISLNKKAIAQSIGIIVIFSLAMYLLYVYGVFDFFTDKEKMIKLIDTHRPYAVLIFICLQILQVVAAPIPGEITGFVGGIFFGPVWGTIYSTIGLTVGSWLAFFVAKLVGRPLVEKLVAAETIKRYDYIMKHKGMFLAFLMFLIPGFPKDYLCYILGLGHMGHRDFLIVSTSGRLLGTTLLTISGSFFCEKNYLALSIVVGISLVVILLAMIYREKIERLFRKLRAGQYIKSKNITK